MLNCGRGDDVTLEAGRECRLIVNTTVLDDHTKPLIKQREVAQDLVGIWGFQSHL